jgi:hypothetical protein
MLAGYIKPLVIRIARFRLRYRFHDLMDKDLPVICYDRKGLIVGDARFIGCHKIPWKDIRLVESEKIVQPVAVNKTIDNSRTIEKHKKYKSLISRLRNHDKT